MPFQADPTSSTPPLEPLFGPEKPDMPTIIYETGCINVPQSPACSTCSSDRSACRLHARKLSRSRSIPDISLTFPQFDDPDPFASDPFAFVPLPPGQEEKSDLQEGTQTGVSAIRPPSAKQAERQSKPFRLLELPADEDGLSSIGPPPGLPSPRERRQSLEGIRFPTQA